MTRKFTFTGANKDGRRRLHAEVPLTPRQIEVAATVRQLGDMNRAAEALGVTYETIRQTMEKVLLKERRAGMKEGA